MFQLDVGMACVRAPEVLFQPSINGVQQSGMAELLANVLSPYDQTSQAQLCKHVLLTGGAAHTRGMQQRVHGELVS